MTIAEKFLIERAKPEPAQYPWRPMQEFLVLHLDKRSKDGVSLLFKDGSWATRPDLTADWQIGEAHDAGKPVFDEAKPIPSPEEAERLEYERLKAKYESGSFA